MVIVGALVGGVIGGVIVLALYPVIGKAVARWLDRVTRRYRNRP